jgi:hypothetical protein
MITKIELIITDERKILDVTTKQGHAAIPCDALPMTNRLGICEATVKEIVAFGRTTQMSTSILRRL